MKKETKLNTLMCTIVILSVALITLTSCRDSVKSWLKIDSTTVVDSTAVAQQIETALNPSFTSVEDVINFRNAVEDDARIDSAFMSIPEPVLTNVVTVLLKQHNSLTKFLIVQEYKSNSKIYNNLPDPPSTQKQDSIVTITLSELQALMTDSTKDKPNK